jgi:mono/diheme cytochrome c family protein
MPLLWTFWLGLAYAVVGVINAGLGAWLWRFPMAPDPGGPDPNGRSTAPRSWTRVHRALGYVFVAITIAMLWEMIPRLWRFEAGWSVSTIVHAGLGLLIPLVLLVKVLVIRRFQKFGKKLPVLGGMVCLFAVVLMVLVAWPAGRVLGVAASYTSTSAAAPTRPDAALHERGRQAVITSCLQCHGAAQVLHDRHDLEDWDDIVEEMIEHAAESPSRQRIDPANHAAIVSFLHAIAGKAGDDSTDDSKGRSRGRGGRRDRSED